MSAFDSFVVRPLRRILIDKWIFSFLLLLLLLVLLTILISTIASSVLWLVVLVLAHSVHVVLTMTVIVLISTIILEFVLEISTTIVVIVVSTSSVVSISASEATSSHLWLSTTTSEVLLPLRLSWSLVAVLVLNTLLSQNELLRSERITRLSQVLVTMGEVALFFKKAVFVCLKVTASLSLILLIEFLSLLLSGSGEALVHGHLVVHHVLLLLELALSLVAHHSHHSLVVEHLLRHLLVLALHLLHIDTHVVHISGHGCHLVCLHLVCSVHIQ
jgi:hypothetical protein